MRRLLRSIPLLVALATTSPLWADPGDAPSQAALKAHVDFLASDELRGREAGTPEYAIAARYVASRFEELGLKPAGDADSFIQKVPLVSARPKTEGSLTLMRGDTRTAMVFGEDYLPEASLRDPKVDLSADLVFAGFGVVVPEQKRDDYAGLDVKGRIVVVLAGAPKNIPGDERAHYGSMATKAVEAARRGAIGIIMVETRSRAAILPFSRMLSTWNEKSMTWRQRDGAGYAPAPNTPLLAIVSLKGAEKLFADVPGGTKALLDAAEMRNGKVKGQPLGIRAQVRLETEIAPAESSNVAGLIEGSDPTLKDEVVILSGHLDHIGVGEAVNGDAVYNGAMDNAVGIAAMIEVARGFMQSKTRPKRSLLFLAVTAEEKGLVGADYFIRHPTVPAADIVANVNLDMPIITFDFEDVVAFGADRSGIGPIAASAASGLGITLSPDPMPEQGLFTRSDHYRFVQQGVPSIFVVIGFKGPGKAATADFLAHHYHKPSDQPDLPFNWAAGARFVSLNLAITRALADAPERPRWNRGDFFGMLYGGPGQR